MNRLGGWWRLWIVGSGLWTVVLLFLAIQTWPSKMPVLTPSDRTQLSPKSLNLLNPLPDDLFDEPVKPPPYAVPAPDDDKGPWKKYQEAEKKKKEKWSISPVAFVAPDGYEKELSYETTKAQVDALMADYISVQKSVLRKDQIVHFFTYLAGWLVPCLLGALIGLAIRWVFRGFKKPPGDAPTITS